MAFFSRTALVAIFALSVATSLAACGHSALDLLPDDPDGGGVEGGGGGEGGPGEGGADADGMPPGDAGLDAGCTGPSCPGLYVSGQAGDDANPGTGAAPLKTISKAISRAAAMNSPQTIYVAAATYAEKVTLVEGLTLLGGYECSALPCAWSRDVAKNDTAIRDQDFEGVLAPASLTRKTTIDAFRIDGQTGTPLAVPGGAAMTIHGSPTVVRCRINGADTMAGPAQGRRSIGVVVYPPTDLMGALLVDNAIRSGIGSDASFGVLFLGAPAASPLAAATLKTNRIQSGSAPLTVAVAVWTASSDNVVIRENNIIAGTSTVNGGGAAWGIDVSSAATIDRNRINVDPATGSCTGTLALSYCGGIISASSKAVITNNVVRGVTGPRTCAILALEAEAVAQPLVISSNTLDGMGGSAAMGGTVSAAIVMQTNLGVNSKFGRIRNNILLGGTNNARYGVYESETPNRTAHPEAFDNNDVYFGILAVPTQADYHVWSANTPVDTPFANLSAKLPPAVAPTGNLSVDPQFGANYHLLPGSPLIDKGTAKDAPPQDVDGDARPKRATFDIGADEVP